MDDGKRFEALRQRHFTLNSIYRSSGNDSGRSGGDLSHGLRNGQGGSSGNGFKMALVSAGPEIIQVYEELLPWVAHYLEKRKMSAYKKYTQRRTDDIVRDLKNSVQMVLVSERTRLKSKDANKELRKIREIDNLVRTKDGLIKLLAHLDSKKFDDLFVPVADVKTRSVSFKAAVLQYIERIGSKNS